MQKSQMNEKSNNKEGNCVTQQIFQAEVVWNYQDYEI